MPEGDPAPTTLRLSRTIRAPRARVFAAFTDPALLQRWWGPPGFTLPEVAIYPRPGGRYRFKMVSPDGNVHWLGGVFREVVAPERLVYTWTWEQGDYGGRETVVTLTFLPSGNATEIRIVHEGFPSAEAKDRHNAGWSGCLGRLEELSP